MGNRIEAQYGICEREAENKTRAEKETGGKRKICKSGMLAEGNPASWWI